MVLNISNKCRNTFFGLFFFSSIQWSCINGCFLTVELVEPHFCSWFYLSVSAFVFLRSILNQLNQQKISWTVWTVRLNVYEGDGGRERKKACPFRSSAEQALLHCNYVLTSWWTIYTVVLRKLWKMTALPPPKKNPKKAVFSVRFC